MSDDPDTIQSIVGSAYGASLRPGGRAAAVSNLTSLIQASPDNRAEAQTIFNTMSTVPTARCVITAAKVSVLRAALQGATNA